MNVFHVTKAENAEQIWHNGIQQRPPNEAWVDDRQSMRAVLDDVGNQLYSDWVSRQGALFFWPTYNGALQYAERLLEPAIVEVHLDSPSAWMIPNTDIEMFFDDYVNYREQYDQSEVRDYARQVVEQAEPWTGQRSDDVEVWMQPPVPTSAIHSITDAAGEPFDL